MAKIEDVVKEILNSDAVYVGPHLSEMTLGKFTLSECGGWITLFHDELVYGSCNVKELAEKFRSIYSAKSTRYISTRGDRLPLDDLLKEVLKMNSCYKTNKSKVAE